MVTGNIEKFNESSKATVWSEDIYGSSVVKIVPHPNNKVIYAAGHDGQIKQINANTGLQS